MKNERPEIDANIQKFIEYKASTYQDKVRREAEKVRLSSYGATLTAMEKEYGKPAFSLKKEEILDYFSKLNRKSAPALAILLVFMGQYVTWAAQVGVMAGMLAGRDADWVNPFAEIRRKDLQKIYDEKETEKAITRKELLNKIEHPDRNHPLNESDKFLLLGIFEGFVGERYSDLIELKWKDIVDAIDGKHYVDLEYNGKIIRKYMSDELYNYARGSYREVCYTALTDSARVLSIDQSEKYKDYVIKPIKGHQILEEESAKKTLRSTIRVRNAINWIGLKGYSAIDLRKYGKIEFIKERAQAYELTPREYAMSQKGQEEFYNQYSDSKLKNIYSYYKKYFE